jgi:P27 family predicted phage terminase small subunit
VRGRKPKATVLKLVSGSRRVRKDLASEPQPAGELFAPPEEMSEREKAVWRRTIARAPAGLLRELDSDVLQLYVETWVEREDARAKVKEFGAVVKSPVQGIPVRSPYKEIANRATDMLKGLISDLGFNPTSRSRISVSGSGAGKANRFANNAAAKRA